MSTLMLERPTTWTAVPTGRQREALLRLVRRLEAWLPAVERRLAARHEQARWADAEVAEWRAMLGLYERLCTALATEE